jgi:2-polyprenyl-6-methoxyphenol hydroxylase-like FAD-dependent oxidoreductase
MVLKPCVAIVGGGPAGLTAAVMLHRGGYPVRVYEGESSEQQRSQGGTLDLHEDSGQVALQRAGLLEAFRVIARHEDQEERTANHLTGHVVIGGIGPEGSMDKPEIDRGELRKLLLDALPVDVMQWDHRLAYLDFGEVEKHGLVFTNGSRVEADIVIGADGAWSKVRSFLSAIPPAYTGITFFEGWIDQPSAEVGDLVGHGTLFCFGGEEALFAQRNGRGRICVYAALKRNSDEFDLLAEPQRLKTFVEENYSKWAPNLRQLLASCESFVRRPIYSLPEDFAWVPRKGITLIGDAAHLMPPVGVGVNLAMLDASDVATALCALPDWANALRYAETVVCERASSMMSGAIDGFQSWFTHEFNPAGV